MLRSSVRNCILRSIDAIPEYEWGKWDCIKLVEIVASHTLDYRLRVRPKWLCNEGTPVGYRESVRRAIRQFGSVSNAYIETLDKYFHRTDSPQAPGVFVLRDDIDYEVVPFKIDYVHHEVDPEYNATPYIKACGNHRRISGKETGPVMGVSVKGGFNDSQADLVIITKEDKYLVLPTELVDPGFKHYEADPTYPVKQYYNIQAT